MQPLAGSATACTRICLVLSTCMSLPASKPHSYSPLVCHHPRVQLTTDLTLSGDFLEHYQTYLTQLVRVC